MAIDPEPPAARMRVLHGLDQALAHTRFLMFTNFNIVRWICFGFIVFLDVLFTGGAGNYFNFGQGFGPGPGPMEEAGQDFEEVVEFLRRASGFILMIMLVGGVVGALVIALIGWISSRGQLMFVRGVALDDHRIDENWAETRSLHMSLFLFRFAVDMLMMLTSLIAAAVMYGLFLSQLANETATWQQYVTVLGPVVIVALLIWAVLLLVRSLLWQFVVPIMWHFNVGAGEAWRIFGRVAKGNILPLHGFYLVLLGVSIVHGIAAMLVTVFTCCIGMLPVLHQILMAPVFVFERAYSMYVLESLGPEFEIIQPEFEDDDPFNENAPRDLTE